MFPTEKEGSTFGWVDTPWIVAALLGIWGVMIGIEEFLFADIFVGLAAVICVVRFYKDTMQSRPRHLIVFVLSLLIACSILSVDFYFTARKRQSTDAHNQEIPGLKAQINGLENQLSDQEIARKLAEGRSDQKLDDIQDENKDLKKSVETKDAALVQIAKDQYALNFFPQIVISTHGTNDSMYVTNNGKTNVTVYKEVIGGIDTTDPSGSLTIVPSSEARFYLSDKFKRTVLHDGSLIGKIAIDGILYFQTLNSMRYSMGFSYYFNVQDGRISESYIVDRAAVEAK